MNKFLITIFFFLNIFLTNALSQIAYIDINFILKESSIGKSLNIHIETLNNNYAQKYNKIEKELIEKENKLLAQKNIIDKNEFDKKLNNLSKEINKYRSDRKKSNDELNQIKINNTKKILKILNPIITKYVENNEISLVFPKKNIIVGKKDLEITNKIIELLNNEVKTLNFK